MRYASVILMVINGLAAILAKDCADGVPEIFQALALVCGGTAIASLQHAVAKGPEQPVDIHFVHDTLPGGAEGPR